ncbi:hypothetical protein ACPA9J_14610 [Pseudomonas aeruginosa]
MADPRQGCLGRAASKMGQLTRFRHPGNRGGRAWRLSRSRRFPREAVNWPGWWTAWRRFSTACGNRSRWSTPPVASSTSNRASGLLDGLDPQRALGMHLLQSAPWLAAEQSTLLRCLAEGRPSIDTLQAYVGAGGELLQYRHRAIRCAGATVACSARWNSAKSSPRPKRPQAWRTARTS